MYLPCWEKNHGDLKFENGCDVANSWDKMAAPILAFSGYPD